MSPNLTEFPSPFTKLVVRTSTGDETHRCWPPAEAKNAAKDEDGTMNLRILRWPLLAVVAVAALVAAFLLGRHTAPVHDHGWMQGYSVGYDTGVPVGRSLEVGDSLSPDTKDVGTKAFEAGYRAGTDDSFGSYDGGWNIGQPYTIVLDKGINGATYRIDQRELMQPGVTYVLCQSGKAVCTK